jgi:hypothetical protein
MGLFTKTIPERKWVDVSAALGNSMKSYRASWFKDFVNHVFPLDIGLQSRELTPQMEDNIAILQFAVAAITIRENAYVKLKDFDFFIDLICISITSKKIADLDSRLTFELLAASDPKIAIQKWALIMLPIVARAERNQQLAEVLSQWAALLVVQSKIQTCEACFDRKAADAISHRDRWRHPDWNTPEGGELREQLERSEHVRKQWSLIERKDARAAAIMIGAILLFLIVPLVMERLNIPLPSWTYIPDWMWRYMP